MKQIILLLFLLYICEWIQRNSPIINVTLLPHWKFLSIIFLTMTMEQTRKMTFARNWLLLLTMVTSNWSVSRSLNNRFG